MEPPRERDQAILARLKAGGTQKAVAADYGLTRNRISQWVWCPTHRAALATPRRQEIARTGVHGPFRFAHCHPLGCDEARCGQPYQPPWSRPDAASPAAAQLYHLWCCVPASPPCSLLLRRLLHPSLSSPSEEAVGIPAPTRSPCANAWRDAGGAVAPPVFSLYPSPAINGNAIATQLGTKLRRSEA